ncbi:MAG TPA: hypothetical protein DCZ03_07970 [Gammaproteobacteria bacterium]|nr:hypothetical protein [Gammaproteobacteria bacterium]
MQSLFASLIIFMTLGITFAQAFVRQLGIEPSYLTIALGAVIFTYLVSHRTLFLMTLMATLTILLQSKTIGADTKWFDPDIILTTLITLVILPSVLALFGYETVRHPRPKRLSVRLNPSSRQRHRTHR